MVGKRKKNRLLTDAFREVKNTRSRFFSILILSALAVAFLSGIKTTAPDMQYTADTYYDRLQVMDGYVLSTLGLGEEDIEALRTWPEIVDVEPGYTLDAKALDSVVIVRSMPERLNLLDVMDGRLPEAADECVTEEKLLIQLGLSIGDSIPLAPGADNEDALERTEFTVVGTVRSPLYAGPDRGTSSLGTGSVDGYVYIPAENFTWDYYTVAFFTVDGLKDLNCYSEAYDDRMDAWIDAVEPMADAQATLRRETVVADAQTELDDAREELADVRADVEEELADAEQELADGRKELDDGWKEYQDGVSELEDSIAEANQEISDSERDLADARKELQDAEQELADGRVELQDGWKEYNEGAADYEEGKAEFEKGKEEYEDGRKQYQKGLKEYRAGKQKLERARASLEDGELQYEAGKTQFDQVTAAVWMIASGSNASSGTDLVAAAAGGDAEAKALLSGALAYLPMIPMDADALIDSYRELAGSRAALDSGWSDYEAGMEEMRDAGQEISEVRHQLEEAKLEIEEGEQEILDVKAELDDALAKLLDSEQELKDAEQELADGWKEYEDGMAELADARETLKKETADAKQELSDALADLQDGEADYLEGVQEYEDGKREAEEEIADAEQKLSDAQAELDDIDACEWYVLSRKTNMGILSFGQDSERISNLANVFPIIFFLVAALACLTTMTRMVEEQRTQIGSMKALGFSYISISIKYIGYAFAASLIGGIVGIGVGRLIPLVIANAFNIMYEFPALNFKFQPEVDVSAVAAAVACTTGAALWACGSTLVAEPAALMRPKAPRAGKRVLLEHIGPLWRMLNFTWKVTMRNLFRYKRRFWMTVIGIGGCTALIVTGFGLHNSIFEILDKQFDEIFLYDATVGFEEDADDAAVQAVSAYLDEQHAVERYVSVYSDMVDTSGKAAVENSVNLFAVDSPEILDGFITLRHRTDGEPVVIPEEGVLITEKLSELLDLQVGDLITLDGAKRVEVPIIDVVENYVQHYVYMTADYYECIFDESAKENAILLAYFEETGAVSDVVSEEIMAMDGIATFSHIAALRDTFTESMVSIDYAVVIVIVSAAVLAFVVLYNLTNINITERTRELATLKVLGFYDGETSAYVYRENVFLTMFGILMGVVMGRYLHSWLILTVEVNYVMFGRTAPGYAYWYAAVLTVVFSMIVNVAAHFKLKHVDMVESLKTVE